MTQNHESDELTAEQIKSVLDERAASLARAPKHTSKNTRQLDVLELVIAGERFAIEARFVREASKLSTLTPLPGTPDFVLGLINFRGQILPLLDLRGILALSRADGNSPCHVVVVQTGTAQAGIAVDEISGITSISETELQTPRQFVRPSLSPLIKGVSSDRLSVLDIEALFQDTRLVVRNNPQEREL